MRIVLLSTILLAGGLQARTLEVSVFTSPAASVTVHTCGCDQGPSHLEAADAFSVQSYPGTAHLYITGGAEPYRITWHGMPNNSFTHISAMAGVHRVTVEDANGERITRTFQIGTERMYRSIGCFPARPSGVPANSTDQISVDTCKQVGKDKVVPRRPRIHDDTDRDRERRVRDLPPMGPRPTGAVNRDVVGRGPAPAPSPRRTYTERTIGR